MYTRLNEVPHLAEMNTTVDALHFNAIRVALLRLKPPIRLPLTGLRGLEILLEPDLWLVVDSSLNDLPVLAWSDFDVSHRDALHKPIACRMRFFHSHAAVIIGKVLDLAQLQLEERMKSVIGDKHSVSELKVDHPN
ncbi:MAG: hypothetical protein OEX00_00880 [Gammaproteobacteria bacterium]|nr:hypothetical protein [Gammaproteobacteria bacterium]MDH5691997.1 hypothetical protein [Gammaproteobacteria bacterium]